MRARDLAAAFAIAAEVVGAFAELSDGGRDYEWPDDDEAPGVTRAGGVTPDDDEEVRARAAEEMHARVAAFEARLREGELQPVGVAGLARRAADLAESAMVRFGPALLRLAAAVMPHSAEAALALIALDLPVQPIADEHAAAELAQRRAVVLRVAAEVAAEGHTDAAALDLYDRAALVAHVWPDEDGGSCASTRDGAGAVTAPEPSRSPARDAAAANGDSEAGAAGVG